MLLSVRAYNRRMSARVELGDTLRRLSEKGYQPLIRTAMESFLRVFSIEQTPVALDASFGRRYVLSGDMLPLDAELFAAPESGILFALVAADIRGGTTAEMTVGYIGPGSADIVLAPFMDSVTEALGKPVGPWHEVTRSSERFLALAGAEGAKFIPASTITADTINAARVLEDDSLRELALLVKSAGGRMLAMDVQKRFSNAEEANQDVDRMIKEGLLAREFVVICRRTSNQTTIVKDPKVLEQLEGLGIRCSCGRPLSDERSEDLLVASDDLVTFLDHSFWTTARLVSELRQLGVSDERILLNVQNGNEEVDAFVDIEGQLVMFELKDGQFSLGHAYPFVGRIGIYKPAYAVIGATKGVAPEVLDYLSKTGSDTEILHASSLDELSTHLVSIMNRIRAEMAGELLSAIIPLANSSVPLIRGLFDRFGIPHDPETSDLFYAPRGVMVRPLRSRPRRP